MALDVRNTFPFPDASVDLIIANMLFNEIPLPAMGKAFCECERILTRGGLMISPVVHQEFADSVERRNLLKYCTNSLLGLVSRRITMTGKNVSQAGPRGPCRDSGGVRLQADIITGGSLKTSAMTKWA